MLIDNILCELNIKHDLELSYPPDPILNPNMMLRGDFLIDGKFVEFFGLKGKKEYDEKILIKKELAKKNKNKLIEIYQEDLMHKDKMIKLLKS